MKKIINKIPTIDKSLAAFAIFFIAVIFFVVLAPDAFAASQPHPPGTCTSDPQFDVPYAALTPGQGIISAIVDDVKNVISSTVMILYFNILVDENFRRTMSVAITLYIAIYGIMFTFGMVQSTVYDFFIRMLKIGIIFILLGTNSEWWVRLFGWLNDFFIGGTDAIIAEITRITVGGISNPYTQNAPFAVLDSVIATAVSAKMAVTILATFFTGPYGILFGILILLSLGSFLRALFTAIWVYLMALVLKTLLIALSPIFISFMLFSRTKPLFDGWINQLVNACLQPIFLFIFFGFFVALIQGSMESILKTPVCWTEWIDSVRGTPFAVHYWRFAIPVAPSTWDNPGNWEPYGGLWSWEGAPGKGTPPFPIDIISILMFLILAELAGRFNNIVIMIASDIAGASVNLASMQGPLSGWLSGSGGGNKDNPAASNIGSRTGPGGVKGWESMESFKKDHAKNGLGVVSDNAPAAGFSANTGWRKTLGK